MVTIPLNELDIQRSPVTSYFCALVQEKTGLSINSETKPEEIRKAILDFESQMFNAAKAGEFHDCNEEYVIKHHFGSGVYAREMHIPAGHVVVGKIHKHENLHFLSKGSATVITELGGIEEVKAGEMMKAPVGVKRLLITHQDTIWTVLHSVTTTDLKQIENDVIAKDYSELLLLEGK